MSASSRKLTRTQKGRTALLRAGLALLMFNFSQAGAVVRYELYKGNLDVPGTVAGTAGKDYYVNGGNDFDANQPYGMQQYVNNLINFTQVATGAAGTSAQIYYPLNSYTLCDQNDNKTSDACINQYEGYQGYTAVFLPKAGTYNFSIIGNDGFKIDYHILTNDEANSANLKYKKLNYLDTSGIMRLNGDNNDGTTSMSGSPAQNNAPSYSSKPYGYLNNSANFFDYTATGPTYLMFRMYWDNWGNTNNFLIGWKQPGDSTYSNIPAGNLCDPTAPAQDCFPDLAIIKSTSSNYVKPSTSTQNNYLDYTLKVTVNPSQNGTTSSYGTTTISDPLPTGLNWDTASTLTAPSGWSCTTGQTISCTTSNVLTTGQTYEIDLKNLLVAQGKSAGTSLINTATVYNPNESLGVNSNNTSTASTKTILTTLSKTVQNLSTGEAAGTTSTALPGQQLQYCITGTNDGGADLPNYTISDYVPAQTKDVTDYTTTEGNATLSGTQYDSTQKTNANTQKAANGLVTSASTDLTPGANVTLCFKAIVP